ncbi:MAG: hypothetical protein MUO62_19380 [Anaerolineales bacterium]|nr:hypothetical protein [Anaerolineales bacterium]
MLNPQEMPEYGFGNHPDILTALEYERLINSAGEEIVRKLSQILREER